jgi:hypothetical protein
MNAMMSGALADPPNTDADGSYLVSAEPSAPTSYRIHLFSAGTTMNRRPKAITYTCHSTENQKRSPTNQISAEGPSTATAESKPALKNLLDYIEPRHGQFTGVVVDDASRLCRLSGDLIIELAKTVATSTNRS